MAADRPRLAFWVHQLVEELAGVLLVLQGLTAADPTAPVVAGVALVALGATADGPIGVARWVPRRWHRVLDLVAIAVLVATALLLGDVAGTYGRVLLVVAAGVLAVLVWRTDYRPKRATGTAAEPAAPSKGETYGRAAGRALGAGLASWRRKPPAPPS